MNTRRLTTQCRPISIGIALCLATILRAPAQTVEPTGAASNDQDEETVILSPFVVEASGDEGYQAKETLAGTRVRTELRDIASSISVVTRQFLQDIGATDNASLLQYTPNTEVGGLQGNFSGFAGGTSFNEDLRRPQTNTRVRGLDAADNTRDYFLTDIPWDSYIVDRVDLQRGPNSILFGVGSPAGIVNTSVNTAGYKNRYIFENRVDQHGSLRNRLDLNYVVIPKTLAIRVAALNDEAKYQQEPAFSNSRRYFGAVRYEPKFFGEGNNTSIRLNHENGDISANRPRSLPPIDSITPWFYTGTVRVDNGVDPVSDQQNLNKVGINLATTDLGATAAWINNPWTGSFDRPGRTYWSGALGRYGNQHDATPTSLQQTVGDASLGINSSGNIDNGIGGLVNQLPQSLGTYSGFALQALRGGGSYTVRNVTDRSIYDFFNKLIDGDNSNQWQKWHSSNLAVDQTFLNDRLAFQFAYDTQRYQDGGRALLGGSYSMEIDIHTHLANGDANPNFGRAFVSNTLSEGSNSQTWIDRDAARFTVTGDLRTEDFIGKSKLATLLGRHVFTGLLSEDEKFQRNSNWATGATTPEFAQLFGRSPNLTAHFRSYDFMSYLGDSLKDAPSAAGANLSNIQTTINVPQSALVTYFDNKWARSTNPTDPSYIDPAAPYTYTSASGVSTTSTQSENPANYGGWKPVTVNFLSADRGDRDSLILNDSKVQNIIKSQSVTWQGHFLDNSFLPVFGWRRDEVTSLSGGGASDSLGVVSQDYGIGLDDKHRHFAAGESKSWGAVLRLPDKWADKLPLGSNISVFYNRSQNFKADEPRGDLFGNQIPNPAGRTKEYGFAISTLRDKLTLKTTWYETKIANTTLTGAGLGSNGYFLWAVPVWGTAFTVNAAKGLQGQNAANEWAWNYASVDNGNTAKPGDPAFDNDPVTIAQRATIEAWRQLPLEQNFFDAYGGEVALINVAALRAGDWGNADPIWNVKFDNQTASGGLVGFSGGPVIAADTLSRGQEYELIAQPTKNWNLSVSASKTHAEIQSIAPTIVSYIDAMTEFMAGPAGDLRLWGGPASNALRVSWNNNVVIPYQVLLAQRGSSTPEVAPWRYTGVTSYNFDSGALKGVNIGGAYRFEDKRILGYGLKNIDDPATLSIDITKPYYGPSDEHLDLWIGFSRKLSRKVNWRIQANFRNVGEKTKLVPISLQPDGSEGAYRIQEGMMWQLSNTFEF